MGVSTDGQICYGVLFEEGTEFPWNESDMSLEDWWRDQNDWAPSKPVYDEQGNRLPGITEADVRAYYQEQREWDEAHPCPVEEVNVCSGDYPIYILAVPSTVKRASRGTPEVIDKDTDFALSPADDLKLTEFLETHEIEHDGPAQWYLSSLWS